VPYWRVYYHLVWSTYRRLPLIDDDVADLIERSIKTTCHDLKILVHAFGTMPDHVHVAVSIPPTLAVSTAVGRMKGAASHLVNQRSADGGSFTWQTEYGLVTFGERNLPMVIAYITEQPAHHAANKLWSSMEPTVDRKQPA
jgi:putative transposase